MEASFGHLFEAFLRTAKQLLHVGTPERRAEAGNPMGQPAAAPPGDRPQHPSAHPDPVWEFLVCQGLVLPRLKEFSVGWIDSPSAMFDRLVQQGFSAEEIQRSKLLADRRLRGRLVGPIENAQGKIVSFWACGLSGEVPTYLYWRPEWKTEVPAVWLPSALARSGRKRGLLVVEDILEAVVLQTHGFARTVALGESGQPISANRWQQFAHLRVSGLTLVLNPTQDVEERLRKAIAAFQGTDCSFRLWILPPKEIGSYGSPGDLVRQEGAEAFRKLLASRVVPIDIPKSTSLRGRSAGNFCSFHHCLETECFCFD